MTLQNKGANPTFSLEKHRDQQKVAPEEHSVEGIPPMIVLEGCVEGGEGFRQPFLVLHAPEIRVAGHSVDVSVLGRIEPRCNTTVVVFAHT